MAHAQRRAGWRVTKEDFVLSQDADAPRSRVREIKPHTSEELLSLVLSSLDDDKAEEVVVIPLQGKSQIADSMVICSGRSSRQVVSIADKLMDRLKHEAGVFSKVEGKEQGDWVLVDAGDVVVHVFRPEVREFYQLEKMWLDGGASGSAASRTV